MDWREQIYSVIGELRLIAAAGLEFASNVYERERYTGVQRTCAQLIAVVEDTPLETIAASLAGDLFAHVTSPIVTVDAVVQRHEKILLIKRHDNGLWALPGGLVTINQTLAEAALRELREETGLNGQIKTLLGIFDSHRWESQEKLHMHHAVFLVEAAEGAPQRTEEALEVEFFAENDLPPLAPGHHRRIPFVFALLRGEGAIPYFDLPGTP